MKPIYDIYKRLPGNELRWVERFEELEQARQRMALLISASQEDYLIYDIRQRAVVQIPSSQ